MIRALAAAAVMAGLAAIVLLSLASGPLNVRVPDLLAAPFGASSPEAITALGLRGPRVLAALGVGAALGASGAAYQTLFRNPLAAPDLLGVSNGAAFGAAVALLMGVGFAGAQVAAIAGGVVAVALTLTTAQAARTYERSAGLILCGLVTGALASGAVSLVLYLADPYAQLPTIAYWLLGSLSRAELGEAAGVTALAIMGAGALSALGPRLDALGLGELQARTLGLPAGRLRLAGIGAATLLTAGAVAVAGVVGWLGLLAPHAARLLVGHRARWLIPTSAVLGAGLLALVDLTARSIGPVETPLGVLTAAIGAPAFLVLFVVRGRRA